MSKLTWDKIGERFYETGVDQVVLFPMDANGAYPMGVAWNGVTGITESPSGAEASPLYADNIKYLNLISNEEFGATIEAYTYPEEFAKCDGSASAVAGMYLGQQSRSQFGLAYRTKVGNDIDSNEHGYKLHIIYGCLAAPSEKAYATINDSPEAITFSWEVTTTPATVTTKIDGVTPKPVSLLTFDSTKVDKDKLAALEAILYGTDPASEGAQGIVARLPMPDEIITLMTTQG